MFGFLESRKRYTVVTFAGGMGAQIISAAIYFSLRNESRPVYADLSYFDQAEHVATVGSPGDCSHWAWQLEPFGLSLSSFEKAPALARKYVELIEDGPKKLALGLNSLKNKEIRKRFTISGNVCDILPAGFSAGYICIHVRRGDYVNVASHMVADDEFIELARKFSLLVKNIVVVSDSPVNESFRNAIAKGYEHPVFMDDTDPFTSHRIMRCAGILICSNSQFSLVAALLNPQALVILPKQWFGEKDCAIEAPIHETCNFQILNAGSGDTLSNFRQNGIDIR